MATHHRYTTSDKFNTVAGIAVIAALLLAGGLKHQAEKNNTTALPDTHPQAHMMQFGMRY